MNRISKLLFSFFLFAIVPSIVLAKPSKPTADYVEDDLYIVKSSSDNGIAYFLVGADLDHVDTYGAINNASYISVPNGTYKIWAKDADGDVSDPTEIKVENSCDNRSVFNANSSGTAERCYVVNSNKKEEATTDESLVTCARNYYLDEGATAILTNNCERKIFVGYNLSFRYCKKTYQFKCSKIGTTENLKLSTLALSTGSLTPEFAANTYQYSSTTTEAKTLISATLQDNKNSFVDGFGPRAVDLNYGLNNVYIKTKSANGSSVEYLIKITRTDTRDTNNRLSSLGIDDGTISPKFNANTIGYSAKVDEDTQIVNVTAELSSDKATFVNGFGPRKVNLNKGYNKVFIKVRSESGAVRIYTINILRGEAPKPDNKPSGEGNNNNEGNETETKKKAILKDLVLSSGIITFDPNVFDYNVVVDYNTKKIEINAEAEDSEDKIDVINKDELEVGGLNEITIKVTSKDEEESNTYTIYVERKEENIEISTNNLLKELKISGYKIKFDANQSEYKVKLKNGDTELKIEATPQDERASITIEGNENLTDGSEVRVRVTAEDGSYKDYFIKISVSKKHGNVFLTIFVILIVILVLAYLVLRAMGYKIVFNFEAVADMIKNIFHKDE